MRQARFFATCNGEENDVVICFSHQKLIGADSVGEPPLRVNVRHYALLTRSDIPFNNRAAHSFRDKFSAIPVKRHKSRDIGEESVKRPLLLFTQLPELNDSFNRHAPQEKREYCQC